MILKIFPFSLLAIVLMLIVNSCVTVKPLPVELERFDRTAEVSSSEMDGIYDITRLRIGSLAVRRIRRVSTYQRDTVNLMSYKLVTVDNATQNYIVDTLKFR